jgi:hypothetical protein
LLISHRDIPFFTVVFWNNLLGTFVMTLYIAGTSQVKHRGFFESVFGVFLHGTRSFFLTPGFILFSGALGLMLNISTFSLLGEASATSYVVVGASKKIVQAFLSYLVFNAEATWGNMLSVATGLCGATCYTYLKWKEQKTTPVLEDGRVLLNVNDAINRNDAVNIIERLEHPEEGFISD